MANLVDVFAADEKIEERTKFEENLLTFIADLMQQDNRKRITTLHREANDLLTAWSAYTGRDVMDDLEYRLHMRKWSNLIRD